MTGKDNQKQSGADGAQTVKKPDVKKPHDPLSDDVEDALLDQDIPVETGIPPQRK